MAVGVQVDRRDLRVVHRRGRRRGLVGAGDSADIRAGAGADSCAHRDAVAVSDAGANHGADVGAYIGPCSAAPCSTFACADMGAPSGGVPHPGTDDVASPGGGADAIVCRRISEVRWAWLGRLQLLHDWPHLRRAVRVALAVREGAPQRAVLGDLAPVRRGGLVRAHLLCARAELRRAQRPLLAVPPWKPSQ